MRSRSDGDTFRSSSISAKTEGTATVEVFAGFGFELLRVFAEVGDAAVGEDLFEGLADFVERGEIGLN